MPGNDPTLDTFEEQLSGLSERSFNEQFIFRVRERLRSQNEEAYEPEMFSIGPYHRGIEKLQKMEKYKFYYMKGIQERLGEKYPEENLEKTQDFIRHLRTTIMKDEQKARNCYEEEIKLNQEEFLNMMIVDGCFIVEFLRKYNVFNRNVEDSNNIYGNVEDDPIFSMQWLVESTCRDLLLFENQLPFFILEKMFALTYPGVEHLGGLIFSAISCLNHCIAADSLSESSYKKARPDIRDFHLLRLMYKTWCSSRDNQEEEGGHRNSSSAIEKLKLSPQISVEASVSPPGRSQGSLAAPEKEEDLKVTDIESQVSSTTHIEEDFTTYVSSARTGNLRVRHFAEFPASLAGTRDGQFHVPALLDDKLMPKALIDMPRKVLLPETVEDEDPIVTNLELLKSVCELQEHGIEFEKAEGSKSKSWLDIKFEDAVMKIPTLVVQDHTESLLRNLIACEEYLFDLSYPRKAVSDYASFMGCLLKSSEDAKILRHRRIIKNLLGKDEVVSEMFNKIGNNIFLYPSCFAYKDTFIKVNEHCSKRRNRWIAELRKTHFKSPWSIVAFLAGTFLLVLTLLQTIFTILK